jgi:protocatechuate 3,4-dioxygenase beta subunit
MPTGTSIARRRTLQAIGVLGLVGCSSGVRRDAAEGAVGTSAGLGGVGSAGERDCALTPTQAEGPFFFDTRLERSDIREGRDGVELRLSLRLLDAADCTPLEGALVEIWHADADGAYSAFDVADGNGANLAGQTFLRGFQRSNAAGRVEFRTIYPGWYPGRTPHVHLMVLVGAERVLITQLYFPESLSDEVYAAPAYVARGARDTSNAADALAPDAEAIRPLLVEAALESGTYAGGLDVALLLG